MQDSFTAVAGLFRWGVKIDGKILTTSQRILPPPQDTPDAAVFVSRGSSLLWIRYRIQSEKSNKKEQAGTLETKDFIKDGPEID
jgi:hypothetical protein